MAAFAMVSRREVAQLFVYQEQLFGLLTPMLPEHIQLQDHADQ